MSCLAQNRQKSKITDGPDSCHQLKSSWLHGSLDLTHFSTCSLVHPVALKLQSSEMEWGRSLEVFASRRRCFLPSLANGTSAALGKCLNILKKCVSLHCIPTKNMSELQWWEAPWFSIIYSSGKYFGLKRLSNTYCEQIRLKKLSSSSALYFSK